MFFTLGISIGRLIGSVLLLILTFTVLYYTISMEMKRVKLQNALGVISFLFGYLLLIIFIPKILYGIWHWTSSLILFVDVLLLVLAALIEERKEKNLIRLQKLDLINNQKRLVDLKFKIRYPIAILVIVLVSFIGGFGVIYFFNNTYQELYNQSKYLIFCFFLLTSLLFIIYGWRNLQKLKEPEIDVNLKTDYIELIGYGIFRLTIALYLLTWARDKNFLDVVFTIYNFKIYRIYIFIFITFILSILIPFMFNMGEKKTNERLIAKYIEKSKLIKSIYYSININQIRKTKKKLKDELITIEKKYNEIKEELYKKVLTNLEFVITEDMNYKHDLVDIISNTRFSTFVEYLLTYQESFLLNYPHEMPKFFKCIKQSKAFTYEEKDSIISEIEECYNFNELFDKIYDLEVDNYYYLKSLETDELFVELFDLFEKENDIESYLAIYEEILGEEFIEIIYANCILLDEFKKDCEKLIDEVNFILVYKGKFEEKIHATNYWLNLQIIDARFMIEYLQQKRLIPRNLRLFLSIFGTLASTILGVLLKTFLI